MHTTLTCGTKFDRNHFITLFQFKNTFDWNNLLIWYFSEEFSFLSEGCRTWIHIQRHSHLCSECSCSTVSVWHTCDTFYCRESKLHHKIKSGRPKPRVNRKYCTKVLNWKDPLFSLWSSGFDLFQVMVIWQDLGEEVNL